MRSYESMSQEQLLQSMSSTLAWHTMGRTPVLSLALHCPLLFVALSFLLPFNFSLLMAHTSPRRTEMQMYAQNNRELSMALGMRWLPQAEKNVDVI